MFGTEEKSTNRRSMPDPEFLERISRAQNNAFKHMFGAYLSRLHQRINALHRCDPPPRHICSWQASLAVARACKDTVCMNTHTQTLVCLTARRFGDIAPVRKRGV